MSSSGKKFKYSIKKNRSDHIQKSKLAIESSVELNLLSQTNEGAMTIALNTGTAKSAQKKMQLFENISDSSRYENSHVMQKDYDVSAIKKRSEF